MSLRNTNISNTTTSTVKYNQWGNRRIETGIGGEKIRLKFGNRGISLGVKFQKNINHL